ncbi:hypothetical protein MRX96_051811 [Rhipicephalus microplus]
MILTLKVVAEIRGRLTRPSKNRPRLSQGNGTTQQTGTTRVDIVVPVKETTASNSKKAACSLMVARLLWYSRLTRFFGCFFVSNLSIETLENAVATWKSPYTAYAALCFSVFLGYQVVALTSISRSVDVHKTFPRHLRFVSYAITVAKVCVNYVSFCLGSQGLLEFLKGATAFETSTSFSAAVKRRLDRGRRLFDAVVRATLFASFVGAFFIALADGLKKLPPDVRSLAGCGCNGRTLLRNGVLPVRLHGTRDHDSLLGSSASIPRVRVAQTRSELLEPVAMIRSSKEYVQQIRYLHSTIEPEQMCLTGASFFRLDRGLLLRGTGSVITFAVILMQTGGDLKRRMGLH